MWPVFCRNYESQTQQSDLNDLFSTYGRIESIAMKRGCMPWKKIRRFLVPVGFAFVNFEEKKDAEAAISGLDGTLFGHDGRRLMVRWGIGENRRHHDGSESNARQTRTLFVTNFDLICIRAHDIRRHFECYGRVRDVRMLRNFAFVEFENQEDATKALERAHKSKILGKVICVDYALPANGRHRNDASSSSAHRHGRESPDYGLAQGPNYYRSGGPSNPRAMIPYHARANPVYDTYMVPSFPTVGILDRARASPVYDTQEGPSNPRARIPDCVRASPVYGTYIVPSFPTVGILDPAHASPVYDTHEGPSNPRARIPDPVRASPVYDTYKYPSNPTVRILNRARDTHEGPSNLRARIPDRVRASPVYETYKVPSFPTVRILDRARASPVYDTHKGPSNPRARIPDRLRASPVCDSDTGSSNPRAKTPGRSRSPVPSRDHDEKVESSSRNG
ncbi:serine/arginine-rich splicing factor RS31-like isoform X1 [Salvia divinorum]|uniref:Serine/arginine-rich splicing factor RS31-like isoform X1 n=1 Tax=Salvia divinorum TaxID=28513 RepID=A0ABD1IB31_SALDI